MLKCIVARWALRDMREKSHARHREIPPGLLITSVSRPRKNTGSSGPHRIPSAWACRSVRWHARLLHESIVTHDPDNILPDPANHHPLVSGHARPFLILDRDDDHSLMEDPVMLEVVEQRDGDTAVVAVHEDRGARHPRWGIPFQVLDEPPGW
jgi:hypothetical protein